MPVILTLAQRELVRFFRQRNRVVGAFAQPVMFWVLFGMGFRSSESWFCVFYSWHTGDDTVVHCDLRHDLDH